MVLEEGTIDGFKALQASLGFITSTPELFKKGKFQLWWKKERK